VVSHPSQLRGRIAGKDGAPAFVVGIERQQRVLRFAQDDNSERFAEEGNSEEFARDGGKFVLDLGDGVVG
jgi:hypothetical protein